MEKIVIELPEEIRQDILTDGVLYCDYDSIIRDAIKNCIVLPKGHGRLIDADKLEDEFGCGDRDIYAMESIREAPTIIEAD